MPFFASMLSISKLILYLCYVFDKIDNLGIFYVSFFMPFLIIFLFVSLSPPTFIIEQEPCLYFFVPMLFWFFAIPAYTTYNLRSYYINCFAILMRFLSHFLSQSLSHYFYKSATIHKTTFLL